MGGAVQVSSIILVCCISFGPFFYKHVAIDFVSRLCCFIKSLLVVFDLCLFLRI
jgi:hypothetical protein